MYKVKVELKEFTDDFSELHQAVQFIDLMGTGFYEGSELDFGEGSNRLGEKVFYSVWSFTSKELVEAFIRSLKDRFGPEVETKKLRR